MVMELKKDKGGPLRFVDYKCNACNQTDEYFLRSENDEVECSSCKSKDLSRVFSGIHLGSSASAENASSAKSCSGSCAGCSGCG